MRITPFKQGRLDGLRRKLGRMTTYTGRRKHDYKRGFVLGCVHGVIHAMDLLRTEREVQTRDQMSSAMGS